MQKVEYNLDFQQALEIVNNGGAVTGENFREGFYLKLNSHDILMVIGENGYEDNNIFTKSLVIQKYRQLS